MNDSKLQVNTQEFNITFTAVCFVLIVPIIFGNCLVITAILKYEQLQTSAGVFIASLAGADLLIGSITIPFYISVQYLNIYSSSEVVCSISFAIVVFPTGVSLSNLFCLAVDRYLLIKNPFVYERFITNKRYAIVSVIIWIYVMLFSFAPLKYFLSVSKWYGLCKFNVIFPSYYLITILFKLSFIFLIITYCYIKIYQISNQQHRRITIMENSSISHNTKHNLKAAKVFAKVIGIFYLCWLPYLALTGIRVFLKEETTGFSMLSQSTLILSFINSGLNAVIYGRNNKQFKDAFKKILKLKKN